MKKVKRMKMGYSSKECSICFKSFKKGLYLFHIKKIFQKSKLYIIQEKLLEN